MKKLILKLSIVLLVLTSFSVNADSKSLHEISNLTECNDPSYEPVAVDYIVYPNGILLIYSDGSWQYIPWKTVAPTIEYPN